MSLTNCRFYEEKYPDIDAFVMVNVKQIAEMGAYVKLLEYDQIDGMILLSELSRRRIRSIQKLIRVGRNEVVVVLRVDKEKGYIDLSKRRVSPEDVVKCEERYNKSKMVHSILRHVAEKVQHPIEGLYETIAWPLNRKYGHSIDAFKLSITNQEVWKDVAFPNDAIRHELISYISKRLTPQPTKVRSDVEVTCYGYEGIDAIKTALRTAEAHNPPPLPPLAEKPAAGPSKRSKRSEQSNTEQAPPKVNGVHEEVEIDPADTTVVASTTVDSAVINMDDTPAEALKVARAVALLATPSVKVKLVSPPLYVLTTQCLEKTAGIKILEEAIERIRESILHAGGALDVKMAPKAVTESDDKELQELMERRERENMEVSGDESGDAEASGEEGMVKGD